jgi:UDP-2,3-diacylglucosamine pyrophosphatase LpxH
VTSEAEKPAVAALASLSAKLPVIYLPGNHDYSLDPGLLQEVLPRVTFGGRGTDTPYYTNGRLRAEHGNAHGMFCSMDPARPESLPLGYFISRLAATAARNTGDNHPNLAAVLKDLQSELGKDTVAQIVLEAVAHRAGVGDDTPILMPDDLWGGRPTTLAEVRALYADLFREFERRHGLLDTILAIPAEVGNLEAVADTYFPRGGVTAVIMGHTHEPVATVDTLLWMGRMVYVNAGCWCNAVPRATWVEAAPAEAPKRGWTLTLWACPSSDLGRIRRFCPPVATGNV